MRMHSIGIFFASALTAPGFALAHPSSADTPTVSFPDAIQARSLASRDLDRLDVDTLPDGTIWVRGRTYKASFGRDAARYVPFLGSDAPRNFPVDLRVERVSIGGVDCAFDADADAVLDAGGASISFDRCAFVERYLLTPDGIEQTFVFHTLPREGDVVVTVDVESEFEQHVDDAGFRFENEHGHVRYGRAFALDASGRKDPIEARLDASRIEIRVPAERVAASVLPLSIDPVLSTFSVRSTAIDEFGADTAYDATLDAYLTVFEEVFSANDHDIRAVRHSAAGAVQASQAIDISASNWRTPAVANNNSVNQFIVVAAVGATPGREIQGRVVAASTLAMSSVFPISVAAESGDKYLPDVGGDPAEIGPSHYYVVWETAFAIGDTEIHGRLVDTGGGLEGLGTQFVSTGVLEQDSNPSISNSNGDVAPAAKYWNVVFEREVAPGNHDIYGRKVTVAGALMGVNPTVVASSALDERNPTCTAGLEGEFGASPWMVAYQIASLANGWDVYTRVHEGFVLRNYLQLSVQFPTNSLHQTNPVCDTDGKGFVVAYLEQSMLGFGTTDIRTTTMFMNESIGFSESNVSVTPGLETDMRPALCAAHSGGANGGQTLIAFDRQEGFDRDVLATTYVMPGGGPITYFCFGDGSGIACPCLNFGDTGRGCANSVNAAGARLTASGDGSIEAENLVLTAEGMPASTSVLFFQGSTQSGSGNGTFFGDGLRCTSGLVIRLGTKAAVGGVASHPQAGDMAIATAGNVAPGSARYYQAHYRNSATFCSPSTFNLTNGVRVYWIP